MLLRILFLLIHGSSTLYVDKRGRLNRNLREAGDEEVDMDGVEESLAGGLGYHCWCW